jgi:hypothetical protein
MYKERIAPGERLPTDRTLVACPSVDSLVSIKVSPFCKGAGAKPAPKEIVRHVEKKGVPPSPINNEQC